MYKLGKDGDKKKRIIEEKNISPWWPAALCLVDTDEPIR